jgi:phenylacetate-coenzyme A ligase PaaK-like adenylate-forming protein
LKNREKNIRNEIKVYLGVSIKVKLAAPKMILRSEGKAKRVEDMPSMPKQ